MSGSELQSGSGFSTAIPLLAGGSVPFDRPWLASTPYRVRIGLLIANPVFASTIFPVVYALTHQRDVDIAMRAPERTSAIAETVGVLIYGALVVVAGQIIGTKLGFHRIGLHLTGSMFGRDEVVMRREFYFWSIYNFAF